MRWLAFFLLVFTLLGAGFWGQSGDAERIANSYIDGNQIQPAIDADNAGNFLVVWASDQQDDGLPGVYGKWFNSTGLAIGTEFQINSYWGPHEQPQVAVRSNGGFVVAMTNYWIEKNVSAGVTARVFDSAGEPLDAEFLVNEHTVDFQGAPCLAMDNLGNFVIAWQSWGPDGDGFGIFARRFDSTGVPLGSEFQVNAYFLHDQIQPAIAMESNGNFVIVWTSQRQNEEKTGVYAQRFGRTGNFLGSEFRINFSTDGRNEHPDISMDGLGNFTVCWQKFDLSEQVYKIFARNFDRTAQLKGPEFQVNNPSFDSHLFPSIDSDIQGNFVITWQSQTQENSFDIVARLFDSYANPQAEEFIVNSFAQKRQIAPDIVFDSMQNLNICWQSLHQYETDWNVYYRALTFPNGLSLSPSIQNLHRYERKKIKLNPRSPAADNRPASN